MPIFCLLLLLAFAGPASATCITPACHSSIAQISRPHEPVKSGNCLACHVRQQEAHPAREKAFSLRLEGSELCYQCHDRIGRMAVVHAPVKNGECLSCHRPHGTENPFLLATASDISPLCFGCHDRAAFAGERVHGPAAAGACIECHAPHEGKEKKLLTAPATELCVTCHAEFADGMKKATVVHAPLQKSSCGSCHLPHSSAEAALLPRKMPELCLDCHAVTGEQLRSFRIGHAPLQQDGSCTLCHLSHFSENKGLLAGDEKSVCLRCHGGKSDGSGQDIRKQLEKRQLLHGPLNEGKCSPCHGPHGGNFPRLLTGPYPAAAYEPYQPGDYDFCLQCHDKNLLRFRDTTIYTRFRDGNLNLHYVHVADPRKGRTCLFCHEAHGSSGPKLISKEGGINFGKWAIPLRFEITPTGGGCAPGCHRPLQYDREMPKNTHSGKKK